MTSWLTELDPARILPGIFRKRSGSRHQSGGTSPERTLKNGVPTGYIDAPGIVPQHRRLDLYRALVLTGIAWLHQQGQVVLRWNRGAISWRS